MKIFAQLAYPLNGYDKDKEKVKGLKADLYEVDRIDIGQSHSSFTIKGKHEMFNTVQFEFYDEHGNEADIFKMPEFNPYLQQRHSK